MSESFYEDPAVRGVGSSSGVHCACGREIPVLVAQWGTTTCPGCKPAATSQRRSLHSVVALEDIADIYGYIERYVQRRFPQVPNQDEYIAEAVAITYRLHAERWDRSKQPSFSKYLSTLLWQRLKDFYRVEMRQSGRGCRGQSEFEYREVDSLDALADIGIEPTAADIGGIESSATQFNVGDCAYCGGTIWHFDPMATPDAHPRCERAEAA